jgi:hypothetical protein
MREDTNGNKAVHTDLECLNTDDKLAGLPIESDYFVLLGMILESLGISAKAIPEIMSTGLSLLLGDPGGPDSVNVCRAMINPDFVDDQLREDEKIRWKLIIGATRMEDTSYYSLSGFLEYVASLVTHEAK